LDHCLLERSEGDVLLAVLRGLFKQVLAAAHVRQEMLWTFGGQRHIAGYLA
jgi:hypothetical protein